MCFIPTFFIFKVHQSIQKRFTLILYLFNAENWGKKNIQKSIIFLCKVNIFPWLHFILVLEAYMSIFVLVLPFHWTSTSLSEQFILFSSCQMCGWKRIVSVPYSAAKLKAPGNFAWTSESKKLSQITEFPHLSTIFLRLWAQPLT